jgi:Cytochrome P450
MTNLQALHTDPQSWGPDSLTWRPSRWLLPAGPDPIAGPYHPREFAEPAKGSFAPWADGPCVCPGRKLA